MVPGTEYSRVKSRNLARVNLAPERAIKGSTFENGIISNKCVSA